MARTVGIGLQSFEKIREQNVFYIDKTGFIKEWWDSRDEVTLITRPRRFGNFKRGLWMQSINGTVRRYLERTFFEEEIAGLYRYCCCPDIDWRKRYCNTD